MISEVFSPKLELIGRSSSLVFLKFIPAPNLNLSSSEVLIFLYSNPNVAEAPCSTDFLLILSSLNKSSKVISVTSFFKFIPFDGLYLKDAIGVR